ncbi:hypothetical protein M0804_008148 [Polistes exclamans]|nr:hypothetical protein M0804_008148 [Polistes exclamans]
MLVTWIVVVGVVVSSGGERWREQPVLRRQQGASDRWLWESVAGGEEEEEEKAKRGGWGGGGGGCCRYGVHSTIVYVANKDGSTILGCAAELQLPSRCVSCFCRLDGEQNLNILSSMDLAITGKEVALGQHSRRCNSTMGASYYFLDEDLIREERGQENL